MDRPERLMLRMSLVHLTCRKQPFRLSEPSQEQMVG